MQYIAAESQICTADLTAPDGTMVSKMAIFDIVDGEKVEATFQTVMGVAFHPNGDLYAVDYEANFLWRIDLKTHLREKIEILTQEETGLTFPGSPFCRIFVFGFLAF
jgi:streptogramin lyase